MSKIAQGTQNTAVTQSLYVYSECSTGLYGLGPPLLYSNESLHKPVRFQVVQMHLRVPLTHSLTVQTPPTHTDIKSESFPLSSYFTKHCIHVQTAGTKPFGYVGTACTFNRFTLEKHHLLH